MQWYVNWILGMKIKAVLPMRPSYTCITTCSNVVERTVHQRVDARDSMPA
jgi:hypothetical protein